MIFGFDSGKAMSSAFCQQTFRGFEFAVALGTLGNGVMCLSTRKDGTPVAPFLTAAVSQFIPSPITAAVFLLLGFFAMALFFGSMRHGGFSCFLLPRALSSGFLAMFYLFVTAAVLSGDEPGSVTTRYVLTALISMFASGTIFGILRSGKRGPNYA